MKVPSIERDFLTDQSIARVSRIAGVDKKEYALAERRLKRKCASTSKDYVAINVPELLKPQITNQTERLMIPI